MQYLVIIEKTQTGYSAYSPDVPGCVAAAETFEETQTLMSEALEFHLEDTPSEQWPEPTAKALLLNIAA